MTFPVVASVAGLAAILAVMGVYSILTDVFFKDHARIGERIDLEFRKQQRDRAQKSPLFRNLGQLASEAMAEADHRPGLREQFVAMVEQSGMSITPGRLLAISLIVGLASGGLGLLIQQSLMIGAAVAPFGAAVPILYVNFQRTRRLDKMRSQLPEAFDLMARVIRAGQTMAQAFRVVADEFPLPISAEFAYCYEQQNLGLPPEVTLRDLTRRTGLIELKIFVLAILIQQQTGGNLAELLGKLSGVVRDRFRIRGVIRTLTSEGRFQGLILLLLPPLMFVVILSLNFEYARLLLDSPKLILATLGCEALGALWIRKIVNFDF